MTEIKKDLALMYDVLAKDLERTARDYKALSEYLLEEYMLDREEKEIGNVEERLQ